MIELLDIAESFVSRVDDSRAKITGIRMSTRPDYINDEILDVLSHYSVKTIELGLQSMSDKVLLASKRGHSSEAARRASALIKQRGFSLIGQMMIGLPESDVESELLTAKEICDLGADGARVYPTVVFYDTELCEMARAGEYTPLDTDEAVTRTARVLDLFERRGVPCIRVGLCASENLADKSKVYGGASHEAIGEMAMSELYFSRICDELDKLGCRDFTQKKLTVYVQKGNLSKAIGQKKKNKRRLLEKYGIREIKVLEKNTISGYNILLDIES
jgi:histone acetyltransferase (RNA polymerase elongator complex component)